VIKLGKSEVGPGNVVYLVAELACAHEGDFDFARRMIDGAIEAEVSAVKFQVFTADGLVVRKHTLYNAYKKFEFTMEQWGKLSEQSQKGGLDVLVDVFEPRSLEVAAAIGAVGLKIHSTNVANPFFLEKAAEAALPVLIGTGGSLKNEIQNALNIIQFKNVPVMLVHGFQGYPTCAADTNLRQIQNLIRDFDVPVGFAGHASHEVESQLYQNILAVGLGCGLLENHITLDQLPSRTDYHSSLLPKEFKHMVSVLREVEIVLGKGGYELNEAEQKYRVTFKSFIVSACDLEAGHILCVEDFAYKRAEFGLVPAEAKKLIGKKLARPVAKDDPLTEDVVVKKGL
jgi:sialic acid synthase SpsE